MSDAALPGSPADAAAGTPTGSMRAVGWRCLVCSATRDIAEPFPWRCPNATAEDRHHVLSIVEGGADPRPRGSAAVTDLIDSSKPSAPTEPSATSADAGAAAPSADSANPPNPFIVYDHDLAWAAYAEANGIDAAARRALVAELDAAVRAVGGVGFVATPLARSAVLSDALGFSAEGGVWVKDETGDVGGSHKARHLATILLHLLAAERVGHLTERAPLAIASCGNAALAAATLAAAARWPIDVYVPTWMNPAFGAEMERLGARIHPCERRAGDPPGDPAMLRFRDAVAGGAIPFSVQGPENALALDGGRTLGWEIADGAHTAGLDRIDRASIQVGGGAFAATVARALRDRLGASPVCTVQTAGCAPLARAWDLAGPDLAEGPSRLGARWGELMTPWANPHSIADGILDDETYDWLGIIEAVTAAGDAPVVAAEEDVVEAHHLALDAGFDVSPTGSAGLAGVLAAGRSIEPNDRVVVVMSGVSR